MKKAISFLAVLFILLTFAGCGKSKNRADTSLRDGEAYIEGIVESINGNSILIKDNKGGKFYFTYSDRVETVVDGWYVVDMSADSFKGKRVKVICSQEIMETFPAQLTGERMIIIEDGASQDDKTFHEGHALISGDGLFVFIDEIGSPIILGKADEDIFKDITTGDRVRVCYGMVLTSYPAYSETDSCEKLSDGAIEDIDAETLQELRKLGWIE